MEPKNEDKLETRMFVPAAILGLIPISNIIGSLIVPRASPTKPPSNPTIKDVNPKIKITSILIDADKSIKLT